MNLIYLGFHAGKLIRLAMYGLALICAAQSQAQVAMQVVPNRIIFNRSTEKTEINLTNTGSDTTTYIISTREYRMLGGGEFEEILHPDADQYFASPYLMFFPRKLKLAPQQTETIEIRALKSDDMTEGEYRSHMCIRTEVKKVVNNIMTEDAHGVTASMQPSLGITIPVIIRVGSPELDIQISDMMLKQEAHNYTLQLALHRKGNISVYGDIQVEHVSPAMQVTRVAYVKGIAVYTPNKTRSTNIKLDKRRDINYTEGSLRVSFIPRDSNSNAAMAEAELILSPKQMPVADVNTVAINDEE